MKLKFTDFTDAYYLVIEADPYDPKVREAAKMLNSFWSGDDQRFSTAETELDPEDADEPLVLLGAAGITITDGAISAAISADATDLESLKAWFARGQEGYPEDFTKHGITLVEWRIDLPSTEDVSIEVLE